MMPTARATRTPRRTARAGRVAWGMKSYSAATRWRSAGTGSFQRGIEKDGRASIHIVAVHRPDGATVRVLLDSVGIGYFYPAIYYRMQRAGVTAARFLHTVPTC